MNRYTLSADSPRWWWTTGLAGTTAVTAVTTLFVLAVAGTSTAYPAQPDDAGQPANPPLAEPFESPCFNQPVSWSAAQDGPLPRCVHQPVQANALGIERSATPVGAAFDAPCFRSPTHWSTALNGPLPWCHHSYEPTGSDVAP